jgi:2-polyprenyl-3-methyl-5-hydroxy-6-metoxy-1,4-benzoquinol methylase
MNDIISNNANARLRVLVAIASYGNANDQYLERLIKEYQSMSLDVDIVVFSNLNKQLGRDVEVVLGLPDKNPWSLPFAHKMLFVERLNDYDLFVYSEDDVLITEKNLSSFLAVSAKLHEDEIPGFIRFEMSADGRVSYPDAHAHFHWNPTSVTSREPYTLANFSNDHAACYALTQSQLRKAIKSGGFLVGPHEWKYDLLCSAATDPYTQCGLTKLVPVSHLSDFSVHHLSNRYARKLGIDESEMRLQVNTVLQISRNGSKPVPLLQTQTKLWHEAYSKDYYEPIRKEVLSLVPKRARSILSIGCGWGATERRLVQNGLRVVALPLDPVICSSAAAAGVEMVCGDVCFARAKLEKERFDCLLFLNVLHFFLDPPTVLSAFKGNLSVDSAVIIQVPNMLCASSVWNSWRYASRFRDLGNYDLTGIHFTSPAIINRWCDRAGLEIETTKGLFYQKIEATEDPVPGPMQKLIPGFLKHLFAPDFVTVAHANRRD